MGKKTIRFGLSVTGIDRAIKELENYKKDLARKTGLLREKITEMIAQEAKSGFTGAVVDDLLKGGGRLAQVTVTTDERENVSVVIAGGEDAVWVEFGAGVYHNGPAGSSPNPLGAELNFTIGGYNKGLGQRRVWGFYEGEGEGRELRLTHGTPAVMPMYNAVKTVCDNIADIAKEIWG
jgi:hypothetical protein